MKVVGIITEYNPFHNGHQYHIEEAKKITGADYCIAVMSGNFVQRGAPAMIDKYSRTEMALQNGADLVLELPVCYATGSAEYFAHGAVSILDKLGIVDYLCFGSESGDIRILEEASSFLLNPPSSFVEKLQLHMKEGLTYPAARAKALENSIPSSENTLNKNDLLKVLAEPNNILGIEYIKALQRFSSKIVPVTIHRKTAHYHEKELNITFKPDRQEVAISSATAIRRVIQADTQTLSTDNHVDIDNPILSIKSSVPDQVYDLLSRCYRRTFPITDEDFSIILKYKLLSEDKPSLIGYADISEDLADRMRNITDYHMSISDFIQEIKTKNMTLTRINRALFHMLLNIRTDVVAEYIRKGYSFYARVLGTKKESSHLLRKIEKVGRIPIVTKVSKAVDQLDEIGLTMLSEDIFAAHVYNQVVYEKYLTSIPNEYKHGIIIL